MVSWLREAGPYIEQFRGKTFVVLMSGGDRSEVTMSHLAEDLVLLNALGVRLVLVQGTRRAIDAHIEAKGQPSSHHGHRRITTSALLETINYLVAESAITFRGLYMRAQHRNKAWVPLVTANFISAKPLGIHEGVDHKLTGAVRKVHATAIAEQLDAGALVYLDHLAHSPAGQLYNLASEEVAAQTAIALNADKLILLGETAICCDHANQIISEITLSSIAKLRSLQTAEMQRRLDAAEKAIRSGVSRCHLLDAAADGALLTELMTTEGTGTMILAEPSVDIRLARPDDLAGLLHLLSPLEETQALVHRSREKLEAEISHFRVVEQDGRILGSAALYPLDSNNAELAALVVDPDKSRQKVGSLLLRRMESDAKSQGICSLFVLTTIAHDWFIERGFKEVTIDALPENRQALYNHQRNSKILQKDLQD
ncbi:amino-acid N-acetyltransferase [Litorivicinus sp.]|nr:amino-acid N-acetyltransferase [Litorivicinus sp.]